MPNDLTHRPGAVHDRPRLGEFLVGAGRITPAQLQAALDEQAAWGGRLGQNLIDQGLIDERALADALARQLYLRIVDLDRTPPGDDAVRLLPVWLAERYGLIALAVSRERSKILVACADPTGNDGLREVRRVTGLVPVACIATPTQIDRATRRWYYGETDPAPSPDPHLHLTRARLLDAPDVPDAARRLEGLERRLDTLLDLIRREERRPR